MAKMPQPGRAKDECHTGVGVAYNSYADGRTSYGRVLI